MKKIFRLKSEQDFRNLFRGGKKMETRLFRIIAHKNRLGFPRFAFVASKAVDKRAVRRNLLRRRAREWIRKNLSASLPFDAAIYFKKEAAGATKKEFYEELAKTIAKIFNV